MKYSKERSSINKKPQLIALAIVLVLAIGGLGLYLRNKSLSSTATAPQIDQAGAEKIDLNPPTEEEKRATEDHKDALVKQEQERNQSPPAEGRTVTPVITNSGFYDDQVEVGAFVSGVYEDTGTCTAVFTKAGAKVTKQTKGIKDATTTRCANFIVPRSEFPSAGSWAVTVSYASPTAQGTSETKTVEVQ